MVVFFDNIMFTIVISGIIAMDTFFAVSAFFAFYRIS
jgi:peptidoglycan/LPS O-acetylase OafA/YrhL